jgi:hypothetical protein
MPSERNSNSWFPRWRAEVLLRRPWPTPRPARDSQLVPGSPVLLVGYGATGDAGSNAGVKNTGVAAIAQITADGILIGSASGVRNCTGDSGGPAIANMSSSGYWLPGGTSRSALADAPVRRERSIRASMHTCRGSRSARYTPPHPARRNRRRAG